MPFVLRRTKEQVLSDLPPKIITDIFCDLSPLQRRLYTDFTKTEVGGGRRRWCGGREGGVYIGTGGVCVCGDYGVSDEGNVGACVNM